MKKKRCIVIGVLCALVLASLSGCGAAKSTETITVTIWHVYGEQVDSPLNDMINEFNNTVGMQKGIAVKAMKVSDTNTIHEAVLKSEEGGPGTEELPDLFVAYPKTVMAMKDNSKLVDFSDYLSEQELAAFREDFIEEGKIDNRLLILPVAKSTELMFVNKTLFDRFSEQTGAKLSDLSTWDGLFRTARNYKRVTGKSFLAHDYFFNYFQLGMASKGESIFTDEGLNLEEEFDEFWKPMAEAAVEGAVWLGSGYASESLRTGDAVISIASSAGILYYSDTVTYEDNTTEEMNLIALPCPVYSSGEKLAMNRGAGICLMKSEPEREEAAMTFLKWLTTPEHNVKFVTKAGYMPVTNEAFNNYLPDAINSLDSPRYKSLYNAFIDMQKDYRFYTPPQYSFYLEKETWLEKNVRQILSEESTIYQEKISEESTKKDDKKANSLDASSTDAPEKGKDNKTSVDNSKLLDECVDEALEHLKEIN
ncbi:MAG: extracellular solute-binding protein [Eubacterium sp.]|nr:extracellular solute-binding protein [Eubacterium sp.]